MYLIIFLGVTILSWVVQANLQSKFKKYSQVPLNGGMTGREVAEKMLRDNGIYNVTVNCTPGHLTDHYNPTNGTVNRSRPRMWPCRAARRGLCSPATALGPRARG